MKTTRCVVARVLIAGSLGLGACTPEKTPDAKDPAGAASDSGKSGGMAGMKDMPGMMTTAMMDSIQSQMKSMAAMSADQMVSTLPMHRSMVANALSQMSADMRGMNMTADAAWTALSDSIRQDLIRLPDMTKGEVAQAMPPHHARVMRLMKMHMDMMGKMGK